MWQTQAYEQKAENFTSSVNSKLSQKTRDRLYYLFCAVFFVLTGFNLLVSHEVWGHGLFCHIRFPGATATFTFPILTDF